MFVLPAEPARKLRLLQANLSFQIFPLAMKFATHCNPLFPTLAARASVAI
jgi:hypothetical protein